MKECILLMIIILKILAAEKPHSFNLNFFQNDYHLIPEWFEVASFDKKYVKELTAVMFKRTRTVSALNLTITLHVNVGNDFQIIAQTYKFSSNEYREFPLRMQFNVCEGIKLDFAGLNSIKKCGNFTGCPLLKERKYHFCNWIPDESKLPPFIPSGRYMAEGQGIYNSKEIFLCRIYVAVSRPEVLKH